MPLTSDAVRTLLAIKRGRLKNGIPKGLEQVRQDFKHRKYSSGRLQRRTGELVKFQPALAEEAATADE